MQSREPSKAQSTELLDRFGIDRRTDSALARSVQWWAAWFRSGSRPALRTMQGIAVVDDGRGCKQTDEDEDVPGRWQVG